MRRAILTCLCALGAVAAAPASLTPSVLGAEVPGPRDATARTVSCHASPIALRRSLTVLGVMNNLTEGDRLQMRFDLYQRRRGSLFYRRIGGPELGLATWITASPGTDVFRVRKPIQNLAVPASYYVRISYRWLNDAGRVYARTSRRTALCVQPDVRPDLRFGAVDFQRVGSDSASYSFVVRNDGRSGAGEFTVVVAVNGATQPPVTVAGLPAGARRELSVVGPRCRGGTLALTVDPGNQVDEVSERNNIRTLACVGL
jgi:CARDB